MTVINWCQPEAVTESVDWACHDSVKCGAFGNAPAATEAHAYAHAMGYGHKVDMTIHKTVTLAPESGVFGAVTPA